MITKETTESNSESQARAQLESIREMVKVLRDAETNKEYGVDQALEDAREAIQNDPLEVAIRSDWFSPGEWSEVPKELRASEFKILLCTGGPAE